MSTSWLLLPRMSGALDRHSANLPTGDSGPKSKRFLAFPLVLRFILKMHSTVKKKKAPFLAPFQLYSNSR